MSIHTWEYKGEKIYLAEDGRFYIEHAEAPRRIHESKREAEVTIDKMLAARHKTESVKLSIPVYMVSEDKIVEATITGVHARNGHILSKPTPSSTYHTVDYYPRTAAMHELLARAYRLNADWKAIKTELEKHEITPKRNGYGELKEGEHETLIAQLLKLQNATE